MDYCSVVAASQSVTAASARARPSVLPIFSYIAICASAEVPDSTMHVSFRHADDPVSALAGGGSVAGTGAEGSFTVERMEDPLLGMRDLGIPAHGMEGYVDTATLVDGSADPRVDAVRDVFRRLGCAASVEVVEYAAERP